MFRTVLETQVDNYMEKLRREKYCDRHCTCGQGGGQVQDVLVDIGTNKNHFRGEGCHVQDCSVRLGGHLHEELQGKNVEEDSSGTGCSGRPRWATS